MPNVDGDMTPTSTLPRTTASLPARPAARAPWRLIPRSVTPLAVAVALLAGVGIAALSVHFHHRSGPGVLDTQVDGRVTYHLASHPRVLNLLIHGGAPETVVVVGLLLTLVCLVFRKWRAAAFALIAPMGASGLTEKVLKPLVDRTTPSDHLAFPSGHTTGAFALALTAAILLLPHRGAVGTPAALLRLTLGGAVLALASGTALALVALKWHYATDTVGGALAALTVVVTVALLVDLAATTVQRFSRAGPAASR